MMIPNLWTLNSSIFWVLEPESHREDAPEVGRPGVQTGRSCRSLTCAGLLHPPSSSLHPPAVFLSVCIPS